MKPSATFGLVWILGWLVIRPIPIPAQLILPNLLEVANPGFEMVEATSGGPPSSLGNWAGDYSSILLRPDQGISPRSGAGMLKFLGTGAYGPSASADSAQLWQLINVAPLSDSFSEGTVTVTASCFVNRVTGNPQTDTSFVISLKAHSGSPSLFDNVRGILARSPSVEMETDANPATWEIVSTSLAVPSETSYLNLQIFAYENVFNDASYPEFDGHYLDDVSLQVSFEPFFTGVRLAAMRSGQELTLSWPQTPGHAFALQESHGFRPWNWSFAASGRTNLVTVSLDSPDRFFRLREVDPLAILEQPQSQNVPVGTAVTLNVNAVGVGTLSYQWSQDGNPIPEATDTSLSITNAQLAQHGQYTVTVTDDLGSITSDAAWVWITVPGTAPTIILHPRSQTVRVGGQVKFSVMVTNSAALPIGYLWRKGFGIVDRQCLHDHYSTYVLTNVQPGDAGTYRVTVTNALSPALGIMSDSATLTVLQE